MILSLDEEGAIDFSDSSALNKRYSSGLFNEVNKVYFWEKHNLKNMEKDL